MIFTSFQECHLHLNLVTQDKCSYCKQPLVEWPLIVHRFHHCDVWLHPLCAQKLADDLNQDTYNAIELRRKKGKP